MSREKALSFLHNLGVLECWNCYAYDRWLGVGILVTARIWYRGSRVSLVSVCRGSISSE